MSLIDWSQAPQGATHFGAENDFYFSAWYKVEGEQILAYTEDGSAWREATDSCVFPKVSSLTARPEQWSGEGLPPVGVPVEYRRRLAPNNKWYPTQINFLSGQHVIYCDSDGDEVRDNPVDIEFRPIRTPEQIAAEDREEAITAMMALNPDENPNQSLCKWLCQALYDAGYRKQEAS